MHSAIQARANITSIGKLAKISLLKEPLLSYLPALTTKSTTSKIRIRPATTEITGSSTCSTGISLKYLEAWAKKLSDAWLSLGKQTTVYRLYDESDTTSTDDTDSRLHTSISASLNSS